MDETFVVFGFESVDSPLGKKHIVETDKGTYVSFSEVLFQQLVFAKDQNAFPLQVTLRQKKRYYTFE